MLVLWEIFSGTVQNAKALRIGERYFSQVPVGPKKCHRGVNIVMCVLYVIPAFLMV